MKSNFLCAQFGAISIAVCAAGHSFARPVNELEAVVVTATRSEQPLTDVLSDVTIIDDISLMSGPWSTLGELLQFLPGLESATHGSDFVSIRGAESRMTLVLIDGVRVDRQDGYINGGGAPWKLLPVDQIERVEVLRGAASGVYGADAMGGVIQLFTRDGRGGAYQSVSFGLSSNNTQNAQFSLADQINDWNYSIDGSSVKSDGYDEKPQVDHSPKNLAWDNQRVSIAIGRQFNVDHHLGLSISSINRSSQYVPWDGGHNIDVNSSLSMASLNWEARWSDKWTSKLSLTEARTQVEESSPKKFETVGKGLLWDNTLSTDFGRLKFAFEQKLDRLEAEADQFNAAQQGKRRQNGVSAGWGQEWGAWSAQINARVDDDKLFGSQSTWGGALGFQLTPRWRIHAGLSTGFRSPTLSQLFDPVYGDRALRPETAESSELGLRYLGPNQEWQAILHRSSFENLISSRPQTDPCQFCWYNVADAETKGLSLSGRVAVGTSNFGVAMDWLNAKNGQTGKRLNLRPSRKLALSWSSPFGPWDLRNEWLFKSARYDDAANLKRLPGFGIWNIGAKRQLNPSWSAQIRLDNILDKSYEEIKDIATPGRRWFMGFVWTAQ